MRCLICAVFLIVFAGPVWSMDEEKGRQFNEAYRAYNEAYDEGRYEDAIPHAKTSLTLAEDLLANRPDQIALMTFNLGHLYFKARKIEEAVPWLELAVDRYKSAFGPDDMQLAEPLLTLGEAYQYDHSAFRVWSPHRLFEDVLDLTERHYGKNHPNLSEPLRRLALDATYRGNGRAAERYLERALSVTGSAGPEYAGEHARNLFEFAKLQMAKDHNKEARKHMLAAIGALESLDPRPLELLLTAHAAMIEIYERLEEGNKATYHVQYIAKAAPGIETEEPESLFRKVPDYPYVARKKCAAGSVEFRFTIDREGRARDVEVTGGENVALFKDAGIEALKRSRFKPKVVDGEVVEAPNQETSMAWGLASRSPGALHSKTCRIP